MKDSQIVKVNNFYEFFLNIMVSNFSKQNLFYFILLFKYEKIKFYSGGPKSAN